MCIITLFAQNKRLIKKSMEKLKNSLFSISGFHNNLQKSKECLHSSYCIFGTAKVNFIPRLEKYFYKYFLEKKQFIFKISIFLVEILTLLVFVAFFPVFLPVLPVQYPVPGNILRLYPNLY